MCEMSQYNRVEVKVHLSKNPALSKKKTKEKEKSYIVKTDRESIIIFNESKYHISFSYRQSSCSLGQ